MKTMANGFINLIPAKLKPLGKVAVFIDAANMLYSQQTLGWKIDYKKLIAGLKKDFDLVFVGFYYGAIEKNSGQEKFFQMLKDRGYTLRTKPVKYIKTPKGIIFKGNLDIELVFDALTSKNKLPRSKLTRYSDVTSEEFVSLSHSSVQQAGRYSASRNKFDTIMLFSGDSDFEILLKHFRAEKKKVIVISTKKHISIELIKNCDKYINLKKLKELIERKPK